MTLSHPAERGDGRRGRFERLAEAASNLTSSPAFSVFCVLLVAAFFAVHAAGLSAEWQILVGDTMTAVTLLLLALLKNAERRAEHALQRKLDAIAAALLEQHEGHPGEAHEELRKAIRMEERL
ncbi:low affinity iron permease family protein [Kitasatospora sp. NBC_00240]|uniref:low affinity iron permease family protein n=1 Tax=Kitasatospora sp. NBC_00240 TaxID=2903567 RepID=UPI00225299BA|nr:low affinity iron permease family protein [Kitasatospora sp. NBC_00240]MCX5215248.1 low affinity iron permease family protein [Kitasatospora sp. NBC_00240]